MSVHKYLLQTDEDWLGLERFLKQDQARVAIVSNILQNLRDLGAKSYIIETDHLDRDFTEAYSAYYAKTFRRHSKYCSRLLFFSCDISTLISSDVLTTSTRLQTEAGPAFLGWTVLRPISEAPVGFALIRQPPPPPGFEAQAMVRAEYTAHAFGGEFKLEGVPMTQQDSRIGACAQAAIWVAARHFHTRHRGPWISTVSITEAATASPEYSINTQIPAGSEGLFPNNIVAALRAARRQPLIYAAANLTPQGVPIWGNIRPVDIIGRYLDSGIPVLLAVHPPGQSISHAITLTGQLVRQTPRSQQLPAKPTVAEYIEAFYANDDLVGPNLRVAVEPNSPCGQAPYNVMGTARWMTVPLPEKVYLPAEKAENISWSALNDYVSDLENIRAELGDEMAGSEESAKLLVDRGKEKGPGSNISDLRMEVQAQGNQEPPSECPT
jgi:hypothetical protein